MSRRKDDKDFDTRGDVFEDWVRNGSDISPDR